MNTETMIRELNNVIEKHKNDFVPTFQVNVVSMCIDIIPKLQQLAEYETIGTVEECREAAEMQKSKKPIKQSLREFQVVCPKCGGLIEAHLSHKYCYYCGQAISWEESKGGSNE